MSRSKLTLITAYPLNEILNNEISKLIGKAYWYFMAVSTFFIAIAGAWVTEKIVEPKLGK
ncbi:AbgT family transporter, partial [Vibrio metschnikovii]|uniref:AbgT family transporter n=1 Tax=Vibrio metschnikovii TaxID=28172 RepID=UPI0039F1E665